MAGVEEVMDNAEDDASTKKAAKHDSIRAADLERVTDYVEEADIGPPDISDAMKAVSAKQTREASEKQMIETELQRVKINKDDVDLIMNELEVGRGIAERVLREHQGHLLQALITLTN